jgi:hypothetical protein
MRTPDQQFWEMAAILALAGTTPGLHASDAARVAGEKADALVKLRNERFPMTDDEVRDLYRGRAY